ncbi:MAG: hypothetical protein JSS49_17270 [Planctomycetes bacterium]|nr:hypothetical protein [Planctomycetota bacterium]
MTESCGRVAVVDASSPTVDSGATSMHHSLGASEALDPSHSPFRLQQFASMVENAQMKDSCDAATECRGATPAHEELESFTKFARERIDAGNSRSSVDELYDEWREAHASHEDKLAIAASLRDMEAGETGRDFDSFANDFRQRNLVAGEQ